MPLSIPILSDKTVINTNNFADTRRFDVQLIPG